MIEKMLEAVQSEQSMYVRIEASIRSYRHRLEIELGGVQARRDPEHAENLRNQINECHACEKMASSRQQLANELGDAIMKDWAPEHLRRGPVN